jgi:hypothetical protein
MLVGICDAPVLHELLEQIPFAHTHEDDKQALVLTDVMLETAPRQSVARPEPELYKETVKNSESGSIVGDAVVLIDVDVVVDDDVVVEVVLELVVRVVDAVVVVDAEVATTAVAPVVYKLQTPRNFPEQE